ncbi:MAG: MBL fold metallo-hydrolase [Desulfovibrionaceae bacterium]|jgi:7,8-dihydropterin-6-yl-methyl-4-(beta-D-ribofuranosyl)aminobenzene 5'-phosphate synthase|nr:MBL fold metallo-hydrolase [Desulfovibrionaceae bacterium]
MSLQITTLVENSPGEHLGLVHEHGLCFHIRAGNRRLLFDTGRSRALLDNAAELRIDLEAVRHVVLSHGHYDHSGGLRHLMARHTSFDVLVGKGFFEEKYARHGARREFLGNSYDARFLAERSVSCAELDEPVREIVPGIFALTAFPRRHPDEVVNERFVIRTANGFRPDDFADEVMLVADTRKGLVALLGCSHPGVKNMLDAAAERLGRPIYAVVGGTHLVEAPRDSLALTLDYFRQKDIRVIGVSHCTGTEAMCGLESFAGRYFHNRTGSSLFVE